MSRAMLPCTVPIRSWRLLFIFALCLQLCDVALSTTTSTVYFRQQSGGSIFAIDGRDGSQTELEGSSDYARFVGMAIHRRNQLIFWSDGKAVKSANAADGSTGNVVVGALVRAVWVGTNFGQTQADLLGLTVKGTPCVSIIFWSTERVDCLVGLPLRYSQQQVPFVSQDDCSIQTTQGSMTGYMPSYNEMVASGTPAPIVERIDIDSSYILPHALAIDDREGQDWLYWSNSADGIIYRSSLQSTAIEVLQQGCWSVRGLTLSIPEDATSGNLSLFFSLESKGTISKIELPPSITSVVSPPSAPVVLRGLRSPPR
ncbi:Six-bladed beta-propeller, TolB-like [Phytophthora cinnamomi]|uniref:Six-bladed beta-propeller, TolB-like n=1 Tax=Phytophthora cinnamomi TaxID=4785 RepID=UPI003559B167|nr:Six-bladed beta-propeller, TolB-like [Phytophthora cinnamomi]